MDINGLRRNNVFYFITTHSIIFRGTNSYNSLKNNAQQKCQVENLGAHLS